MVVNRIVILRKMAAPENLSGALRGLTAFVGEGEIYPKLSEFCLWFLLLTEENWEKDPVPPCIRIAATTCTLKKTLFAALLKKSR